MIITLNSDLEEVPTKYDVPERFTKMIKDIKPKGDFTYDDNINTDFCHNNYMDYLVNCYDRHLGYVLTPDTIWYVLLSEISEHIKGNSEHYRSLFTTSDEKTEIVVNNTNVDEFPLEIIKQLRGLVPTDIDKFLPEFTTSTVESKFAHSCSFCDAVSPYYNYGMMMCGFRKVKIEGTSDDWVKVMESFRLVSGVLDKIDKAYVFDVLSILSRISFLDSSDANFYDNIFALERCGSGGQVEVTGWFQKFYMKKPSPRYTYNYSTQVSQVNFTTLWDGKKHMISSGILGSNLEDGFAVPQFEYVLFHLDSEEEKEEEDRIQNAINYHDAAVAAMEGLKIQKTAIKATTRKFDEYTLTAFDAMKFDEDDGGFFDKINEDEDD